MDTIKAELDSEDETCPSGIGPQFVDIKQEDMSEPFIIIDKFEEEVGHILHIREGMMLGVIIFKWESVFPWRVLCLNGVRWKSYTVEAKEDMYKCRCKASINLISSMEIKLEACSDLKPSYSWSSQSLFPFRYLFIVFIACNNFFFKSVTPLLQYLLLQ
jgi:hypothetical protein